VLARLYSLLYSLLLLHHKSSTAIKEKMDLLEFRGTFKAVVSRHASTVEVTAHALLLFIPRMCVTSAHSMGSTLSNHAQLGWCRAQRIPLKTFLQTDFNSA